MDLLDKLDRENKQEQKKLEVEKNPCLDCLLKLWELSIKNSPANSIEIYDQSNLFSIWNERYTDVILTKEKIKEFCLTLVMYQNLRNFEIANGLFLSGLINNCVDQEIILPVL